MILLISQQICNHCKEREDDLSSFKLGRPLPMEFRREAIVNLAGGSEKNRRGWVCGGQVAATFIKSGLPGRNHKKLKLGRGGYP